MHVAWFFSGSRFRGLVSCLKFADYGLQDAGPRSGPVDRVEHAFKARRDFTNKETSELPNVIFFSGTSYVRDRRRRSCGQRKLKGERRGNSEKRLHRRLARYLCGRESRCVSRG